MYTFPLKFPTGFLLSYISYISPCVFICRKTGRFVSVETRFLPAFPKKLKAIRNPLPVRLRFSQSNMVGLVIDFKLHLFYVDSYTLENGSERIKAFRFSIGAARDLRGARGHNQPAHALGGVCLRARRAAPRARGPPRAPGSRYGVRPRALPTQIISYSLGNVTLSSRTSFPRL